MYRGWMRLLEVRSPNIRRPVGHGCSASTAQGDLRPQEVARDVRSSDAAARRRGAAQIRERVGEGHDRHAPVWVEHHRRSLTRAHAVLADERAARGVQHLPAEGLHSADLRRGAPNSE